MKITGCRGIPGSNAANSNWKSETPLQTRTETHRQSAMDGMLVQIRRVNHSSPTGA